MQENLVYPSYIPWQPVRIAAPIQILNQLQQAKGAGVSSLSPVSPTVSPNTQGLPQAVNSLSFVRTALNSLQWTVTISFTRNPADPYFREVRIFAKQGQNNSNALVASGSISPISFTMAKTRASTTFIVQSSGNWGATPINYSPVVTGFLG